MRYSRLLLLLSLISACGGGSAEGPGQDHTQAPPNQIALHVEQARQSASSSGRGDLNIAVTIANGAGGMPVPLNPLLFQVQTSDGLLYASTGGSVDWVDGAECDPTVQVGAGSSSRCTLAFDLKSSSGPTQLRYAAPGAATGLGDTRTATAPISLEPCSVCGTNCTYLDRDKDNCGGCGNTIPDNTVCAKGTITCSAPGATYCPEQIICTSLQTDSRNCGSCGSAVESGQCENGMPVCDPGRTLIKQPSGWLCADLTSDASNCGAPGNVCKDHVSTDVKNPVCRNSKCGGLIDLINPNPDPITCASKCASDGLKCDDTWFSSTDSSGNKKQGGALFHAYETATVYTCADPFSNDFDSSYTECGCMQP
jgi:hypothetical protein